MSYLSLDAAFCKPFIGSYKRSFIDDNISDESDYGSGSSRQVTTEMRKSISYTARITSAADFDTFEDFVESVGGTLSPFYFTDIFRSATLLVKFSKNPDFTPVVAGSVWDVSVSVEEY